MNCGWSCAGYDSQGIRCAVIIYCDFQFASQSAERYVRTIDCECAICILNIHIGDARQRKDLPIRH